MVYFVQKGRAGVIRMYEKQGTPPCGAFNAYIWNSCMDEIAGVITDIALLRVAELHFSTIPQEKLACAELRTISFEQTINIKINGDTVYFASVFFGEFVLHTCDQADAPGVEDAARLWVIVQVDPDTQRAQPRSFAGQPDHPRRNGRATAASIAGFSGC